MTIRILGPASALVLLGALSACGPQVQAPRTDTIKVQGDIPQGQTNIFQVEWVKVEFPNEMTKGKEHLVPVTLKNVSNGVWPAKGQDEKGSKRVAISYHWLPATGEKPVVHDGLRTFLEADLVPGGSISPSVTVLAPPNPGTYRLQLTLVQEEVSWFELMGAKTETKSIVVR